MPENIKPTENFLDSRINYTPKPANPFKESVERKSQQVNANKEKYNTLIAKAQNDPKSLTKDEAILWNNAIKGLENKQNQYLQQAAVSDNFQSRLIEGFDNAFQNWNAAANLPKYSAAHKIIEDSINEFYNSKKLYGNTIREKLGTVDQLIANKDYKNLYNLYNEIQKTRDNVISKLSVSKVNSDPKFIDEFDTSFSSNIKNIADALKVADILNHWAPNTPTEKILQSKELLNNIGVELSKEVIGSSNYGGNNTEALFKYSTDKKSQGKMMELDMIAINAIQSKDQLALVSKTAELARLTLYNKKSSNKIDTTTLENEVKQLEQNKRNSENIDPFKYSKRNYPEYYRDVMQHTIETIKANDGSMLDKAVLATKTGLKGIYNNYMDLGALVATKLQPELSSDFRVLNQTLRYDRTGYVIGFDEKNNPVESTQFYWKDSNGNRHFNGYSIISSGLPVAEQMLKTVVLTEATGGLLSGVGKLAGKIVPESVLELGAVKSVGNLLKNSAVTNRLNTFSSVYVTTYPSMYFEELKNFKNSKDAEVVAKARAVVESLTESIIPNTPDLFKVGVSKSGSFLKSASAAFDEKVLGAFPGVSSKTLRAMFDSRLGKRVAGISSDLFQEGIIEEEASLLGNHIVDKVFAEARNMDYQSQHDITWDNIAKTAIESTAGMLLTAGFMGGGTKRADRHAISSARFEIANNPEQYKSWIKAQIDAGEITKEEGVERIHKINTYKNTLDALPIKLNSIRDLKTLIEDKDAQLAYFTKSLEKDALTQIMPTDEQKEAYDKELANIDKELYKTEKLAGVYENLSTSDKDVILAKSYFDKFKEVTSYEDLSPQHLKLIINAAKEEIKKNSKVKGVKHLENYVSELEDVQSNINKRFAKFLLSNNETLTFEQLAYKANLLELNKEDLSDYYYNKISRQLNSYFNSGLKPLMEIEDETEFIESLAKNYVTGKEKEIPLTTNGKSLVPYISELYVNDGLFTKFLKGLDGEVRQQKINALREQFFNRVKDIKTNMKPEETFPGVAAVEETPQPIEVKEDSIIEELRPAYKEYIESEESEERVMNKAILLNKVYSLETIDKFLNGLNNIVELLPEEQRPLLAKAIQQLQDNPTDKNLDLYNLNFGKQLSKEKLQAKIKLLYNIEDAPVVTETPVVIETPEETPLPEVNYEEEGEIANNNILTQTQSSNIEFSPTSAQMTFVDSINTSGVEESIKSNPNIRMMNAVMDKMVGINPSESALELHTLTASIGFIYGKIFDSAKIDNIKAFKDGSLELNFEQFVELFSISNIPVHDPGALASLYKHRDKIGKQGEVFTTLTDRLGNILSFNINGEVDDLGTPFITTLSYKKGVGKELVDRIKNSPNLTILSPVTKLTDGITTHSQILETSEIVVSQISEERQGYSLKKGVAYVYNKNNPQRPYEHIILKKNTPDSAKLLVQVVNAYNNGKAPVELQKLTKTEFIAWFKTYAYLANRSERRGIDIDIVTAIETKDGKILPERIAFRKKTVDADGNVKWIPLNLSSPGIVDSIIIELTDTYRNINNEMLTSQDRFPQLSKFPHLKIKDGKASIVVFPNYKRFITSTDFGATVVTKSNRAFVFSPLPQPAQKVNEENLEFLDIDALLKNPITQTESNPALSDVVTPEGFTNRVFESNMQLGEAPNDAHISEEGFNYRVLSQNEIDAIRESGGVFAREGKQKGGNKNTKYWTKGNNKNWYGDKDNLETIRVNQSNFSENEVVRAENVEVFNKETGKFEPLVKSESLLSKEQPTSTTQPEIEAKKADIEKLEKEKQEALQPLIEEKEQIEKEIEEIEKNDNGSVKQEVETIDDFLKNNNITEQQLKDEENKLKNHLDELGLKLDTEYNFEDIINRIIKNVKGRFLKTVLKGINSLVGNKLKTKFVFSSVRHEDAAGQYFSHDDTIKIYIPNLSLRVFTLNKRGKEYQQETNIVEVFNKVFIHELIHAFTILKIRATETNAKLGLATIMNPSIEKERLNISRSDQKTIDSLNKIFDFLKNNELLKGEYGVSDIVELVTEALSNEGFAEKLKSIELPKELRYKTDNNNVFENIILYISKLVEDLLNLGSAYSDDNALDSIAAIINDFGISYSESDQQSFMKINKAEEKVREYFKYGKFRGLISLSNQSDNLGSETTKLQQLKQKLAEVNKKIDAITKRFDSQIAQKQAELKALEAQITPQQKQQAQPPSEDDLYSIQFNNEITDEQNKKAKAWVENHPIFKNTEFIFSETIKHPFAYAKWSKAAIELFQGSNYGEAYHEAWHEFTQYYLTPEEKRDLYSQASKKYNSDDILFLEEKMAEEFREFALSKKGDSKFRQLFNKILDFIKAFVGEKKTIDRYFQVLYRGNFQGFSKSSSNLFYDKLFSAKKLTIDRLQEDGTERKTTLSYTESAKFLESFDSLFVKVANSMYNPLGASFVNTLFKESSIDKVYNNMEQYLSDLVDAGGSSDITMEHLFNFNKLREYHRSNSLLFSDIDDYISQDVQEEEQYNADNSLSLINKATNEISQKENAPQIIINMIRVLPKIEQGVPVLDINFNTPVLGAFDKNWKILQKNLNGLSSYEKMYKKIQVLSDKNPQFKDLLSALPKEVKYKSDLIIKNNFFNLFSQPFVPSLIIKYNTGAEFKMSPRFSSSTELVSLRSDWANTSAIYTGEHKVYNPKTETYNFDIQSFLNKYPSVPTEKQELSIFLDALGFKFNPVAFDTLYEDMGKMKTKSNLQYVLDKIKSLSEIKSISASIITDITSPHRFNNKTVAGQTTPVNELLQYELNTREDSTFDMHENAAGDKTYAFNPNTYISILTSALNDSDTYPTLNSLYKDFPQLNPKFNAFISNSYFLERLFNEDGTRKSNSGVATTLELIRHNGIDIDNNGDKLIEVNQSDKMISDIKGLLDPNLRVEEITRLGDKSTTNIIRLSSKDILWDGQNFKNLTTSKDKVRNVIPTFVVDTLFKYLKTEVDFAKKPSFSEFVNTHLFKNGEIPRLGFFDQIFSDKLKTEIFNIQDFKNVDEDLKNRIVDDLTNWFNGRVEKTKKIIQPSKPSEWGFNPNNLNTDLFQYHIISFISRMEQFKLFFGHPFYYKNAKDVEKRLSAWNASGTFPVIDSKNAEALADYNSGENLFHKYASKLDWEVLPRNAKFDELPYLVFKDTQVKSSTALQFKEQYGIHADTYIEGKGSKKQDAAAIATIDFIKKFYSLTTGWTEDMQREYERQMKIWELLLENKTSGKRTKDLEIALNEKAHFVFNIKKLQYAGNGIVSNEIIPVFHKYSVAPLLPSIVAGDNKAFDILSKLYASSVDYGVFESGTKISETTLPVDLFDEDNNITKTPSPNGKVFFKYLKEQQVVENKKSLQTIFATQFRKLAFKDLTTDSEKSLFETYKNAIKELVDYDIASVLEKFDSAKSMVGFILNELETKNISNSTKDAIRLKKSGELEFILDAFLERTTIESAVVSSIKNKIIKQKYYGNQVVQYPTSLYRPSKQLKFYRKDEVTGEVLPAETIVQFNKKYYPLLTLIGEPLDVNGEPLTPGSSLRILNKKLLDKNFIEDNIEALTIIGVRIPTQGLNSMEHFQIVEFLPEESGQIILVPDEMVIKSGSDYDIDKLFIYQTALNKDGKVISDDQKQNVFAQLKGKTRGISFEDLQTQMAAAESPVEDKRLILQNNVISAMKKRLRQEEIFNDLIEPNNVDDIDRLAKSINYIHSKQFEEKTLVNSVSFWSNILNPNYQAYVFELNAYKKSLGIDAKSNTFQAMAQEAKLAIVDNASNVNFILPHNVTKENKISLHGIYNTVGQKISNVINQFISGHVDIMKNDNIALLNYNNTVTPVGLYMIQAGVDLDLVTKLVLSPLVVRYSKGEDPELLIREIVSQDEKLSDYLFKSPDKQSVALFKLILNNHESFLNSFDGEETNNTKDLLKLVYFLEMEKQSKKMSRLSQLVDYDTDSPQNFEYYRRKTQELEDLSNEQFFEEESLHNMIHNSLISPFRINDSILETFGKLFPITMNPTISKQIIRTYELNANRKSVDFDSFSRKYKNALMTSILSTNVPEISEYVQYMIVDNPNNIAKQFIRLKNKYPQLQDNVIFSEIQINADPESKYLSLGLSLSDLDLSLDIFKEQFRDGLNFSSLSEEENLEIQDFFRIFAYTGILSTQLNKTRNSYIGVIPEELFTPIMEREINQYIPTLDKEKLKEFEVRFKQLNPELFKNYSNNPNPNFKFFKNYNLNTPVEEPKTQTSPVVVPAITNLISSPFQDIEDQGNNLKDNCK